MKFKSLALVTASLLVSSPTIAQSQELLVRWPHAGRIWYGGQNTSEMTMIWYRQPRPAFKTYDKFVELDIQIPKGYVTGCISWTDLPDPYDDCQTGGFLDGDTYNSYGVGSYRTDWIGENLWYTARFTYTRSSQTSTGMVPTNAAWQETYISVTLCPNYPSRSPHCLYGYEGGRIHRGVPWQSGRTAVSSWEVPVGGTKPFDYRCDLWYDPNCGI